MAPLLSVEGLSIAYGKARVVDNVSFSLQPGEILGIVGASGSGKSTLLRAISGLLDHGGRIISGRILFRGEDLTGLSEKAMRRLRGRAVGMIFQNAGASFCPVRTIGAQIHESVAAHRPCTRAESDDEAAALFERLGLTEGRALLSRYPFELSGGMNQRVEIAAAMLPEPALLLADEPTSALDVITQRQVIRELLLLRDLYGMAVILVSHDISVCERSADRLIVLHEGRIVETGPTAQVLGAPRSDYTKQLLEAVPRVRRG